MGWEYWWRRWRGGWDGRLWVILISSSIVKKNKIHKNTKKERFLCYFLQPYTVCEAEMCFEQLSCACHYPTQSLLIEYESDSAAGGQWMVSQWGQQSSRADRIYIYHQRCQPCCFILEQPLWQTLPWQRSMLTVLPCSHRLALHQCTLGPAQEKKEDFYFFLIEGLRVNGFNKLCSKIKWMCCDMMAGVRNFPSYSDLPRLSGFGFLNIHFKVLLFTCRSASERLLKWLLSLICTTHFMVFKKI